jgi:hypothetical protein
MRKKGDVVERKEKKEGEEERARREKRVIKKGCVCVYAIYWSNKNDLVEYSNN